ncbi:sulfate/molybdate ABC transporter ATP-binding protein [Gordonia sp. NPDC003429]
MSVRTKPAVADTGLHVSVRNRVPPLDVDIEVPAGGALAVMGPNGAGKTTLLHVVAGLLRPDGPASISLGGTELVGRGRFVPPSRRGIALLTQDAGLFPHLTVRQNVAFAPTVARVGRRAVADRTDHWLEVTETSDLADRKPAQLSGGQAQRVAIARAMAAQPRLLLLDEPLRALDVAVAARIRALLRTALADNGQTALFVTHDVVDAVMLAQSVVIIDGGRVAEHRDVRRLLSAPRSEFGSQLAGLTLLEGTWDGRHLHTPVGEVTGEAGDGLVEGGRGFAVFAPSAVSLFTRRPEGASPRNIFTANVLQVEPHDDRARVRATSAGVDLSAEVTWESVTELGIDAGVSLYLTVKAPDVRIYA